METFYKTELDAVKAQLHSKHSEASSMKLENDRLQVRVKKATTSGLV